MAPAVRPAHRVKCRQRVLPHRQRRQQKRVQLQPLARLAAQLARLLRGGQGTYGSVASAGDRSRSRHATCGYLKPQRSRVLAESSGQGLGEQHACKSPTSSGFNGRGGSAGWLDGRGPLAHAPRGGGGGGGGARMLSPGRRG